MDKSFVTESAEQLTEMAEKDIVTVKLLIDKKFYPENYMYNIICFHATQAVEKLLKSYIINNSKNIEKTHDLDYLHKVATEIDASFTKIKNDCILLNKFCPKIKHRHKTKYQRYNKITERNLQFPADKNHARFVRQRVQI